MSRRVATLMLLLTIILTPLSGASFGGGLARAQDLADVATVDPGAGPAGLPASTETPTQTAAASETATETPQDTPTNTPTDTPTSAATLTSTATSTGTATTTSTATASATATVGTATTTATGSPTRTSTPKPTNTPKPTKTATPIVTKSQLVLTVSCRTDPEKIRITNNGSWSVPVRTVATLWNPGGDEPFPVIRTLKAGRSMLFESGAGANGGIILTKNYILTDAQGDKEGAAVKTSVGTLRAKCPALPAERWIEVNLSAQYLIAWQGGVRMNETYVSTGRPGYETPTGTFYINTRYRFDDMAGCLAPAWGGPCEQYSVPQVPYVQYFTNEGHALHGTYWHDDFGNTHSHGCINLPTAPYHTGSDDFAAWLWNWAGIGTRLYIHY
ncbi:MAG: L,D-transpeptidase [Thermomicrobiales bacterium]